MKYSLLLALLGPFFALAQGQDFTLEDAVTKRFSHYYPKSLPQLQWIPETDRYAWVDTTGGTNRLVAVDAADEAGVTPDVLLTTVDLANLCDGYSGSNIPRLQWVDADRVFMKVGGIHYVLNVQGKQVDRRFKLPEGAHHSTFSNDYNRVAYILDHNLHIADAGGKTTQVTSDGEEGIVYGQAVHRSEFGITSGLFWSPDGNKLAFYRMDERMVTNYPLVDIQQRPAQLTSIKYPMAGDKSHHVKVGVFNVSNGGLTYLQTQGDPEQYLCSVTWTPSSDDVLIAQLNRDQNHMEVNLYDAKTGVKKAFLFEEKSEKYVEPEHRAWFLPDAEDEFLWFSERHGFQHLYHYNLKGELLRQVTRGNWEVHKIYGFDDSRNYLMLQGTGEPTENGPVKDDTRNGTQRYTYLVDFELGGTQLLDSTLGTHTAMLSPNGNYLIELHSSIEVPLRASLYSQTGKFMHALFTAPDPTAALGIAPPELFSLPAGDGQPLYARMIRPSNFDPSKQYPCLIYVYGGPHAQLVRNQFLGAAPLWMYWLAEQGYVVATVDNRGSANRGLNFEQATFRNLGQTELEDQKTLIDYLTSQPYIDHERLAVHGWSYGGFMTMKMLLAFPGTFKAGVAGGPVCDWRYYEVMYTERYMDHPSDNPEGYEQAALINKASALEDDLLIIHGTMDDVVVWQHSQAFVKACVDAGVQLDYFPYPGHAHNVRGRDRAHLMTKVLEYIQQRLSE